MTISRHFLQSQNKITNTMNGNEIYAQDCESLRHQDNLKWSRLKTATTIEAVVLIGIFQIGSLDICERRLLMIIGFLIVFIILLIVHRDIIIEKTFLVRIKSYEDLNNHVLQANNYPSVLKGNTLYKLILLIITALNIFITIYKW
jgi:hypothetical protein